MTGGQGHGGEDCPALRAAAAVSDLRAALSGIDGARLSPEERRCLLAAGAAADRLDRLCGDRGGTAAFPGIDPAAFDPTPLRRLFALIGPADAADLTARLRADLVAFRRGIAAAFGPPVDLAALRRHAHGLIAVAGTCGATGLHRAAQAIQAGAEVAPDPALLPIVELAFDAAFARLGPGPGPPA